MGKDSPLDLPENATLEEIDNWMRQYDHELEEQEEKKQKAVLFATEGEENFLIFKEKRDVARDKALDEYKVQSGKDYDRDRKNIAPVHPDELKEIEIVVKEELKKKE